MTTVTVFTAERMAEIEAQAVVGGTIVDDHLILEKHNGSTVDAGVVSGVGVGTITYDIDTESYYRYQESGSPQSLTPDTQTPLTDTLMDADDGEPAWGHWEVSGYQFVFDVAGFYDARSVAIFDSSGGAGTGKAKLILSDTANSGLIQDDYIAGEDLRLEQQMTNLYRVGDAINVSVICTEGFDVVYADLAIRKLNLISDPGEGGGGGADQTPWTSDIDADTFNLQDVGAIESNVNTVATSGATETLDTSQYSIFDVTMDVNCTFTFSNPAPSGKDTTFSIILRGAFTPTWPAAVIWPSGVEPTYDTPSIFTFKTVDSGTTWFGMLSGGGFA